MASTVCPTGERCIIVIDLTTPNAVLISCTVCNSTARLKPAMNGSAYLFAVHPRLMRRADGKCTHYAISTIDATNSSMQLQTTRASAGFFGASTGKRGNLQSAMVASTHVSNVLQYSTVLPVSKPYHIGRRFADRALFINGMGFFGSTPPSATAVRYAAILYVQVAEVASGVTEAVNYSMT